MQGEYKIQDLFVIKANGLMTEYICACYCHDQAEKIVSALEYADSISKTPQPKDQSLDFKIGDNVYYIGETCSISLLGSNTKYKVTAINCENTVCISHDDGNTTFLVQISDLSKTPPAKEKSFLSEAVSACAESFGKIIEAKFKICSMSGGGSDKESITPLEERSAQIQKISDDIIAETGNRRPSLKEHTKAIKDRLKAAGSDKDAISRLSRGGPINQNSLFRSEEERQGFIKSSPFYSPEISNDEPECQNPAAAHFVTIADFIESGRYLVTRSECVQPEENKKRFILTVEIVESAGGDRE